LLPSAAAPAAQSAPETIEDPEDGVQRTLRAPRARLRGPGRRGPRQGDGRQGEGREARQGDGQGSNDSGE
jgi:hypothetical protein